MNPIKRVKQLKEGMIKYRPEQIEYYILQKEAKTILNTSIQLIEDEIEFLDSLMCRYKTNDEIFNTMSCRDDNLEDQLTQLKKLKKEMFGDEK